jgi:hypothetical protein
VSGRRGAPRPLAANQTEGDFAIRAVSQI